MNKLLLAVCIGVVVPSCGRIPAKTVTLLDDAGPQFVGRLKYQDGLSGTITLPSGPLGENYSGQFTNVDQTPIGAAQSSYGLAGQSSAIATGHADATGYWYAIGDRGSKMTCTLVMGRLGHGHGTCDHSNGKQYQIIL